MIRRILLSALLIYVPFSTNCQDTIYLDIDYRITDKNSAFYFQIKHYDNSSPKRFLVESFYVNGSKSDIKYFIDNKEKEIIGAESWHLNGQIKSRATYKNGVLNDTLFTYWENAQLKRKDIFKIGKLLQGTCYDLNGKSIPHFDYEIRPSYPGGDNELFKDIYNTIKMPEIVKAKSLSVKVIAKFVVDIDGIVKNIEIVKGKYPEVNNEVIRTLSLLKKWHPGLLDGEPVRVRYSVPISFEVR